MDIDWANLRFGSQLFSGGEEFKRIFEKNSRETGAAFQERRSTQINEFGLKTLENFKQIQVFMRK